MIRDEAPADAADIRFLLLAAFGGVGEAGLVEQLRADGDAAIALVAEADGEIVGHILFSPMSAPFPALGLAPLAVAESHRGRGIAGRLIRAGLERAAASGCRAVFVLGDPAFYGRYGFRTETAAGFASPYAGPYLMALALDGELPVREGAVGYAPAFAALG